MTLDTSQLPRTTPILTDVIMNPALAATLFQTYARIYAAAWRSDYKHTDWLSLDDLGQLLGKLDGEEVRVNRATVFRRLGQLRDIGLISWANNGKNRMRISIVQVRPELVAKSQLCDPSSSSSLISLQQTNDDLLLLDKSQKCDPELMIDREAWEALGDVGFGEPPRTTLSELPHVTAKYVRAMAAQFKAEGHGRSELGMLKFRMESLWAAPEWCEACGGLDGKHADTCPTVVEARTQRKAIIQERIDDDRQVNAKCTCGKCTECIWRETMGRMQLQLTGATFDTWLRRTRALNLESDGNGSIKLTVECQNGYAKDWLENRLLFMLKRELAEVTGKQAEIMFEVAGVRV
jgi:hypothetical protein